MKQLFGSWVEHCVLSSGITAAQKVTVFLIAWAASWSAVSGAAELPIDAPSTLDCPKAFPSNAPQAESTQQQYRELARLTDLAEACDTRSDFHAYRGALLLSSGRTQEAAVALEKALLLDPDLAGVQIDYAQALSRLGQRQTAQELVNQVTARTDIDPLLKQWLLESIRNNAPDTRSLTTNSTHLVQNGHSLIEDKWLWDGRIQTLVGREANLAGVSHTSVLPLYLDSGIVNVDLVDSERPRSGSAHKLLALVNGARPLASGQIRWTSVLQARHTPSQTSLSSQGAETRVTYGQTTGIGAFSGTLGWSAFRQTQGQRYKDRSYRLEYQPDWSALGCTAAAYVVRVQQSYADASDGSGKDEHAGLSLGCGLRSRETMAKGNETVIDFSTGRFTPQISDYPGGIKSRTQVQIQHHIALSWADHHAPATLSFFGRWRHNKDQQIVSSLLGPEPTQTRRAEVGVGYWHPIHSSWSLGVELDYSKQRSSNKLLDIKNRSIYTGIRWVFQ